MPIERKCPEFSCWHLGVTAGASVVPWLRVVPVLEKPFVERRGVWLAGQWLREQEEVDCSGRGSLHLHAVRLQSGSAVHPQRWVCAEECII